MNKDIAKNICTQMVEDVEGLCECPRYNEKDKTCIGCKELAIKTILEENKKLKEKIENLTTLVVCGDTKQIKNTAQYKLEQLQQRIDKAIELNKQIKSFVYNEMVDRCVPGSTELYEWVKEELKLLGGNNDEIYKN